VSYALNYGFQEYEPWGWHALNLLIHAACACLVVLMAGQLGCSARSAALAGMLFALHPVNCEAVNYISSRSESLAAAWYLASLALYLRGVASARHARWQAASAACFAAALLTKSSAIVLPAALLVYELWRQGAPSCLRRTAARLTPHALVAAGYLFYQRSWLADSLGEPVRSPLVQLWTQLKAGVYYVELVTMPVALSVEHGFTMSDSLLQAPVLAALGLLLSLGLLLVRRVRSRAALLCAWAVLSLLPASLVPLNVLVNEHRLYLPLAFAAVGLAIGLERLGSRRASVRRVLLLCLLGLAVLTRARTAVWRDEFSLWQDAVRKAPGMYRTQMHWGGALEQRGQRRRAVAAYQRAVALAPHAVEPWYNLGNGLRGTGQSQDAAAAYAEALHCAPRFVPAMVNLAALHTAGGDLAAADSLLGLALTLEPRSPVAHQQLGVLRRRQGRSPDAAAAFQLALQLDPGLATAHYNLGNLWFDLELFQESAAAYRQALALAPDHAAAYLNLGDLYLRQEDHGAAVALLRRGVQRALGEPRLWLVLGRAHEATGALGAARSSYERYLQQSGQTGRGAAAVRQHIQELREEESKLREEESGRP
jgi:protein O-mannosyl-transferase